MNSIQSILARIFPGQLAKPVSVEEYDTRLAKLVGERETALAKATEHRERMNFLLGEVAVDPSLDYTAQINDERRIADEAEAIAKALQPAIRGMTRHRDELVATIAQREAVEAQRAHDAEVRTAIANLRAAVTVIDQAFVALEDGEMLRRYAVGELIRLRPGQTRTDLGWGLDIFNRIEMAIALRARVHLATGLPDGELGLLNHGELVAKGNIVRRFEAFLTGIERRLTEEAAAVAGKEIEPRAGDKEVA